MNKFQKSEKKGRELLEGMLLSLGVEERNMFRSIGRLNPVDFFFIHKSRKFCVEIKVRDAIYKGLETHFLEAKKAKGMEAERVRNECTDAIYVNFFGDDCAVVYNLKNTKNYKVTSVKCNRYTAVNSNKVAKDIIECPASDGIWLNRVNNRWIIV